MSPKLSAGIAVIGIDIGKNSFHVGLGVARGVLLVFGAPCQFRLLAGPEQGSVMNSRRF